MLVLRGRAQIVQAEDERDARTEAESRMNDDVIIAKRLFVLSNMSKIICDKNMFSCIDSRSGRSFIQNTADCRFASHFNRTDVLFIQYLLY